MTVSCRTHCGVMTGSGVAAKETLIIFYDAAIGKEKLMRAVEKQNAELLYDYKNFNGIAIAVPVADLKSTIDYYTKVDGVLSVSISRQLELHQ